MVEFSEFVSRRHARYGFDVLADGGIALCVGGRTATAASAANGIAGWVGRAHQGLAGSLADRHRPELSTPDQRRTDPTRPQRLGRCGCARGSGGVTLAYLAV